MVSAAARRRGDRMKRRELIRLLGGAAAWPLVARAQQSERVRRLGILMNIPENDPEGRSRLAVFLQALQQLGWSDGRNIRIDTPAGPGATPTSIADTRRIWSRSRRMSFWPLLARAWRRCCRRAAPYRSCSRMSSIQSAQDSSRAWRGRAATPPDLLRTNTA